MVDSAGLIWQKNESENLKKNQQRWSNVKNRKKNKRNEEKKMNTDTEKFEAPLRAAAFV